MISKKYNVINNAGGWLVFIIALITYWLTLEPTASYWDCGEFIIQADKLEVGHPPGNPIFMLTARFFANFATSPQTVSVMVNAMSGLLSALTIMLLFWTITHLVRRLVVKDNLTGELSLQQYLAIMGSGLVGALAYCWSDTFWFSAVEGEVYAFSSFCTALVFWLILKWENRADNPDSDKYLILIAYIIGVSVAVHLLNLLCIPAIVLVFAYRRFKNMNLKKSLLALLVSFIIVFFVLYGLVPGFIKVAQRFELFFVNTCGLSFNTGALIYAITMTASFVWALYTLHTQRNLTMVRVSFLVATALTGIFFIGSGVWIGLLLLVALAVWLWFRKGKPLPTRVMNVAMWSMAVIFVGYSSYALILIRSSADTPMNQNAPDNVFDLASYLNREQYGSAPLLYGETLNSSAMRELVGMRVDTVDVVQGIPVTITTPSYRTVIDRGAAQYAKGIKGVQPVSEMNFLDESEKLNNADLERTHRDYYVKKDYAAEPKLNPELNMLFPRIYERGHAREYAAWVNLDTAPDQMKVISARDQLSGEKVPELDVYSEPFFNESTMTYNYPVKRAFRPSFTQNLSYFLNYQLGHMYLRYFMWNFAGRQNDILNQDGELDAGNWISGIPFIDSPRLGDQSLLPDDLGKNNKGHNVYYMLPLILGIIGLLWQSFAGRRGIEQFWVVFFLFFMTGIAIVLYLNQYPGQPRERDYAFAGSFYAFAIWIGMGVAGLWRILLKAASRKETKQDAAKAQEEPEQSPAMTEEPEQLSGKSRICAAVACVLGLIVPLQMVSQTWDDHDRSGRYTARDFAINYLESLEPNAIVFCNGDNDTFPLWYVQEVEGVRPDVRIINLSYLNSDWYANQMRMQAYDSAPVRFTATPQDYAYGRADVTVLGRDDAPADLLSSLKLVYQGAGRDVNGYPTMPSSVVTIPVDKEKVLKRGLVAPRDSALIQDRIVIDLRSTPGYRSRSYLSLGEILMLDIIATNAANGWERPIYWASTVGSESHVGLTPYLRSTGMTHQLVPTIQEGMATRDDRAYDVITKKYRWGGVDDTTKDLYLDETSRRMLVTMRSSMLDLASELLYQGDAIREKNPAEAKKEWKKAVGILDMLESKLPAKSSPYSVSVGVTLAELQCELGSKERLDDAPLRKQGLDNLWKLMTRYAPYLRYNAEMTARFGANASMTIESRMLPYQYWRFIELYEKFGGNRRKVDELLKKNGITAAQLKENHDALYNRDMATASAPQQGTDEQTLREYTEDMVHYCEIANELSTLSPEEYASRSEEERLYDSILSQALEYYLSVGGTLEELDKHEQFRKLDLNRSQRIGEEYKRNHAR